MSIGTYDGMIKAVIFTLMVVILAFVLKAAISTSRTRRKKERMVSDGMQKVFDLNAQQSSVIDAVIAEIVSDPNTYETFPSDLQNRLYAAHEASGKLIIKGK